MARQRRGLRQSSAAFPGRHRKGKRLETGKSELQLETCPCGQAVQILARGPLALANAKRLGVRQSPLILTQKNPCWTCIVNPLDLLDFQGFDGRGRPTGLPPKPATRLCTGLFGGFGCLAHVFLGKDEALCRRTPKGPRVAYPPDSSLKPH